MRSFFNKGDVYRWRAAMSMSIRGDFTVLVRGEPLLIKQHPARTRRMSWSDHYDERADFDLRHNPGR